MKRSIVLTIVILALLSIVLTACSNNSSSTEEDTIHIKIGASPVPHAEILNEIQPMLKEKGIEIEIIEFTDYIQPNIALAEGQLDYNFFQHEQYLETFAAEHELDIVGGVKVHVEPMGLYSRSIGSLDEIIDGASIAIPNDPTNGGRALILLQENGLIKLKEDSGLEATDKDILENPKNLQFVPVESAQLPRVLEDVDAAVINTNYALEANLNPKEDSIIMEDENSPYLNLIALRKGEEDSEVTKALEEALTSDTVREFIESKYQGAILPVF